MFKLSAFSVDTVDVATDQWRHSRIGIVSSFIIISSSQTSSNLEKHVNLDSAFVRYLDTADF